LGKLLDRSGAASAVPPNGDGIGKGQGIPTHWTAENFRWTTRLPGAGNSSPVVWGDEIFVTSAAGTSAKLTLLCIRADDGSIVWQHEMDLVPYPLNQLNSFAASTPTVDAQHVYLAWLTRGHYMLTAFDHRGRKAWEQDFGVFESQHGFGSSPILVDGQVVLVKDPDGESCILSVDAKDGHLRWKTPIRGRQADYATPCLFKPPAASPVLVFTSLENGVTAFEPDTGRLVWELPKVFSQRCVASPVIASGLIIGSCGSGGGGNYVAAVRPPGGADHAPPVVVYRIRRSAPYVPTSLAVGKLVFLWSDAGIVTCLEAASGEVKWQERVGGRFFASPLAVDDRLFGISTSGEVVVLRAPATGWRSLRSIE
jgi:outer membrane protein assembly factor BamB